MNKNSKIYVAGHKGLVGGAIYQLLQKEGYKNLVVRTHAELDLENENETKDFFNKEKPEYVFLCAAKAGGIKDNSERPAEFIYRNLKIQNNVIDSSYKAGVKKLLFMGSACMYPRLSDQPIKEEYYMTGKLEPTNEAYAIAKMAGVSMCQSYKRQYGADFISVIPTNVYGPNDHFETERSHVIPSLIRKFYDAKKENKEDVTLWGTGIAIREFIHCDDLASATLFLMQNYSDIDIINVSTEVGTSIKELSELMKEVSGFTGKLIWDSTKPDGMPVRMIDGSRLGKLGWKYSIPLDKGLKETYKWFEENAEKYK